MMKYARFRIVVLLAVVAGLGLFASHAADAQQYNRFGPANGILKGVTTSPQTTPAISSDVLALWTGTCNASSFLRGDGSCQVPSGTTTGANPTAPIGLTAVNGVASTFLRSDGAPALDQSITPTWTGQHTFTANPVISKTDARFCIYDVGQDATWFFRASTSDTFRLYASDTSACTTTSAAIPLQFTAAAGTTSNATFTATDFSFVGKSTTTGQNIDTFVGTGLVWPFSSESTQPGYAWNETDAGVDEKWWRLFALGGQLVWSARNDANTTSHDFMVVNRNGLTVDSLAFSPSAFFLSADGASLPALPLNGTTAAWNFGGDGTTDGFMSLQRYSGAAIGGSDLAFSHSRGVNTGVNTIVVSGDELGSISFMGANGTGYDKGARIMALVDGTPGASADMPGRLEFQTTADGSATPTTRVSIESGGNVNAKTTMVVGNGSLRSNEALRVIDGSSAIEFGEDAGGGVFVRGHDGTFYENIVLDGNLLQWKSQGGTAVNMTPISGSFTIEFSNQCTQASLPFTVQYYKIGSVVTMQVPAIVGCTSDTTSFLASGNPVPSAIRPTLLLVTTPYFSVNNNSVSGFAGIITITSAGLFQVERCGTTAGSIGTCADSWTNTGTKSVPNPTSIVYLKQ